jgi:hypothetical protein
LLENREEVAKVVRTFKRELFKQFPAAKDALKRERIVFLPLICGYSSLQAKSLRIQDGVYYVGSQVRPDEGEPSLQNLDRLIDNARRFGHLLAAEQGSASNAGDAIQPNA